MARDRYESQLWGVVVGAAHSGILSDDKEVTAKDVVVFSKRGAGCYALHCGSTSGSLSI